MRGSNNIQGHSIWRTTFLIRDISVFSKDKFCRLSFNAFGVNLVKVSLCAQKSSANGGDKDSDQMILPVENRMCPFGLEEREVGNCFTMGDFRKAGCLVMLLLFSASFLVRGMPVPPISYSCLKHSWMLSLAFCWNLAAKSIKSVNIFSHHDYFYSESVGGSFN